MRNTTELVFIFTCGAVSGSAFTSAFADVSLFYALFASLAALAGMLLTLGTLKIVMPGIVAFWERKR